MARFIVLFFLTACKFAVAQLPYTSFFTGSSADVSTTTQYGICLMGGATEDDNAMKWFINRSGGGDIVVIRATGGNGYNNYIFSGLGLTVNSVETLVIPSLAAANHPYVSQQLRNAEAIFIAGGNQFDYVSFWKNTAVDSAINYLIKVKACPIGGTSAGMAIQGQAYFDASIASITSSTALMNPYSSQLTLGNNDFIHHPFLKRVITDTHYDNPDRRGRHSTFIARLSNDSLMPYYGIACDEYTAVCIDQNGIAKVFGGFPTYNDNAYFIRVNCDLPNLPETCVTGTPLTWNRSNKALKVYAIKGDSLGTGTFNLNNWQTGSGGIWQDWYVINGTINYNATASAPLCTTSLTESNSLLTENLLYPNPVCDYLNINFADEHSYNYQVITMDGKVIIEGNSDKIDMKPLAEGVYFVKLSDFERVKYYKIIKN